MLLARRPERLRPRACELDRPPFARRSRRRRLLLCLLALVPAGRRPPAAALGTGRCRPDAARDVDKRRPHSINKADAVRPACATGRGPVPAGVEQPLVAAVDQLARDSPRYSHAIRRPPLSTQPHLLPRIFLRLRAPLLSSSSLTLGRFCLGGSAFPGHAAPCESASPGTRPFTSGRRAASVRLPRSGCLAYFTA